MGLQNFDWLLDEGGTALQQTETEEKIANSHRLKTKNESKRFN